MLLFLMKRIKVIEIVVVRDIVFVFVYFGVCVVFSRGNLKFFKVFIFEMFLYFFWIFVWIVEMNRRICFLNVSLDEVIRSLFYNKNNDFFIIVFVYVFDNFSFLKCRFIRIEYVCFFFIGFYFIGLCEIMRFFWLFF